MERYDAVVIGGGPNGLTAAITLARASRSVLLVEAAPALGGGTITQVRTARTGRIGDRLLAGEQGRALRQPPARPAWTYTHVPAGVDWSAERERFADVVERQIERFAPGFATSRSRAMSWHRAIWSGVT